MFQLQDLPPDEAHFCLQVERFLFSELQCDLQGKKLLIAFSGGVDSTALLQLCRIMQTRWQSQITAAHLDHNLRPDSGKDSRAAADVCTSLNVPCFLGSSRVRTYATARRLGLEAAGRRLRYRFLEGIRQKIGADLILTAHQLNDLAEDSLMRQLRGTGWPALAGMKAWDIQHSIVRPFLVFPKKQLVRFVKNRRVAWQEDASNQDLGFLRNRVRQHILPRLVQENPNYLAGVAQLWRQARIDEHFLAEELKARRRFEQNLSDGVRLSRAGLAGCHPALRLRWYKDILMRLGPGQIQSAVLFDLDRAWQQKAYGKHFQFPGQISAEVQRTGIDFWIHRK